MAAASAGGAAPTSALAAAQARLARPSSMPSSVAAASSVAAKGGAGAAASTSEAIPATDGDANAEGAAADADKKRKRKPRPKYLRAKYNPCVYLSGLPPDVTDAEIEAFVVKCGILDAEDDGRPFIRTKRDSEGTCLGHSLVKFLRPASVQLAMDIIDGTRMRDAWPAIKVERAKFTNKKKVKEEGDVAAAVGVSKGRQLSQAQKERRRQEGCLSWAEGTSERGMKIVIIQNMHLPKDFEDPYFKEQLRLDVMAECSKQGAVDKVTLRLWLAGLTCDV
jgi:HIV Tat-specific factor 1